MWNHQLKQVAETVAEPEVDSVAETVPEIESSDMKIETLDLDNVDSLEDLTKLDLTEVDVKHPESEIINLRYS